MPCKLPVRILLTRLFADMRSKILVSLQHMEAAPERTRVPSPVSCVCVCLSLSISCTATTVSLLILQRRYEAQQ